jgi:hypothetical protein
MRCCIPNYDIYRTDRQDWQEGGTAIAIKKRIPCTCADIPNLLSVEVTGICIPIENTEILLAAVY